MAPTDGLEPLQPAMLARRRASLLAASWAALPALFALSPRAIAQGASGDAYPNKPLRWIVPYAAGGVTDRMARDYAAPLAQALGQPVVVDNRAGANSLIGTQQFLALPADGYTLFSASPTIASGPFLYPGSQWPEDPLKAMVPVSQFIRLTNAIIVPAASPVRSITDLQAQAKGQPVLFGTPGVGAAHHIAMQQASARTGIEMRAIPYKGSAPLIADLLGGHLSVASDNLANWVAHHKSGRARVIMVLGARRSALLPDVPCMGDLGHADFSGAGWTGLVLRSGTPRPIVERLSREIQRITRTPEFKRYEDAGDELVGSTPEEFAEHIRKETARARDLISRFNIKPE